MKDKTRDQLIAENEELRRQVATLEGIEIESKRAEEDLRRSRTILSEAETLSHTGAWEWDLCTNRWTFSDEWLNIHGCLRRTLTPEELLCIAHPDDREAIAQAFEDVRNGVKPYEIEHRIIRQDTGEVRVAKARGQYVLDSAGKVTRVFGFAMDITEQKRAEQALQESEERFRLLVEAIPQPIWRSDADGNVTEFNRRWHEYTGQTAEEAQGSGWTKALHPDEAAMVVGKVRAGITSGEAIEIVNRLRRASDGSYRWHLARAIPMNDRDGKIIGWFGCATDIDDQKRAEEALTERETQLLEAQEVANLGFHVVDLATGHITTSPILDRIFGIPHDYERTLDKWSDVLHPDDRQEILDYFKAVVGEKKSFDREYRIVRYEDRQVRWVHGLGRLQFNEDGQPISMIGTVQDITERKRAEAALRESEERFQAFMDNNPALAWMKDEQGRHVYINQSHEKRFGLRLEDRLGKTDFELWSPETAEQFWKNDQTVLAGNAVMEVIEEIADPDGGRTYWWNFKFPFQDATGKRYVGGVGVDITGRKRAEEALQKAHDELERRVEERTAELAIFKQFAEASGLGFGMTGLDGRIAYVNSAWLRLVGESQVEDVLGQHISTYCPKEYLERRDTEVLPALLRNGLWQGEFALVSRDGRVIPAIHSLFPIRDKGGNLVQIGAVVTDITERKQTEESLRASEERFRVMFEEAPVGMAVCVGDGVIVEANRALCHMSGYTQDELAGRHVRDLTHPADRELSGSFVKKLLGGEIPSFTLEKRYLRKDGQPFWAQATTAAIHDGNGEVAFALGIVEDITVRKEAEEALRQSERRFRNYFDQGLIGMAVTSMDKRWLEVNDRLCEIMGHSRDELLRSNWAELTHPEDLEPNLQWFNRLLAGEIEHYTLDKRFLRKNGSIVYTTIHIRAFRKDDGSIDHIVALTEDITARKQAEKALRTSEEKYRGVVEANPDAIVMSDLNGRMLFASRQTWGLLGLADSDELVGRSVFDYVIENDRKRLAGNMSNLVGVGVRRNTEYTAIRKDGTTVPAEASSTLIRDAEGRPKAVMAVIRNITERKQAEEALERERRTLKHMLQASDHERQLIAYDIHDGLAQYLTGAIMQLDVSNQLRGENPREAVKAHDAGMLMVRQSLAEARRLISGVRPPILDESGIVAAVAHLVYEYRGRKGPKVEFHSEVDFGRLAVVLENSIYRIVQEGLSNASKHSTSEKVRVELVQHGDQVRIVIRDQGVGFDPKSVEEGRFGLEGMRERARLLGGKALIDSTPGKGTQIVVELPIVLRKENNE